jgi:hypothetical protein
MTDFPFGLDDDGQEIDCPECGGEGFIECDCDEDTCCCADPSVSHSLMPCPLCTPRSVPHD